MKHIAIALSLSSSVCLLPASAFAQEQLGTLTASIDGTEQQWFLTAKDGESQSSYTEVMKGLTDISLWGHATDDSATSVKGALLIDFNLMSMGGGLSAVDATLQYLEDGYGGGYLAVSDGATRITVTAQEKQGEALHITGSFSATASYSDNPMQQQVDDSKQVTIEGSFDAVLPPS